MGMSGSVWCGVSVGAGLISGGVSVIRGDVPVVLLCVCRVGVVRCGSDVSAGMSSWISGGLCGVRIGVCVAMGLTRRLEVLVVPLWVGWMGVTRGVVVWSVGRRVVRVVVPVVSDGRVVVSEVDWEICVVYRDFESY